MSTAPNPPADAYALLSLPPSSGQPDAYATLGLVPRESNAQVIKAALRAVVANLNAVKAYADPAAWKQAALWVKEAQRTLGDPQLKARLDRRLAAAMSAVGAPRRPRFFAGPVAPLSAVTTSPVITMSPATASPPSVAAPPAVAVPPVAVVPPPAEMPGNVVVPPSTLPPPSHVTPPGAVAPPAVTLAGEAAAGEPPAAVADASVPIPDSFKPRKIRRRKRQSPWVAVAYLTIVIGSIGGLVGLIVFLSRNPVVVTQNPAPPSDGAAASPTDQPSTMTRPARRSAAAPGTAMTEDDEDWTRGLSGFDNAMASAMGDDSTMDDSLPDDRMGGMNDDDGDDDFAADWANEFPNMGKAMPSLGDDGDDEQQLLDAGDTAIQSAKQAIAAAKWGEMTATAEAAVQAAASDAQRKAAGELLLLAQLASSYHAAIDEALQSARGKELQVTDELKVAIVSVTSDAVAVKFNGRDRQFGRDAIPLVIAHRLAQQVLPADGTRTKIAAEAYQAVAPVTTTQYRYLAMNHLDDFDSDAPELDPRAVVRAILQAFPQ